MKTNKERYREYCEERRKAEHDAHNVIESLDQLTGYTITEIRRHKPGVVQYFAIRKTRYGAEQIIGYAKDEVFQSVQLPP